MSEPSVVRWQKYGKDRLYVTSAGGVKLGFYDFGTGEAHVAVAPRRAEFEAAVRGWNAELLPATAEPTRPPAPPAPPPVQPVPPAWALAPVVVPSTRPVAADDLALRRAGQEVRRQAIAARQAAPVKTFVARVLNVHTAERAWRIGADGEQMVGDQLAMLRKADSRWHVIHSVPIGDRGSDIDHVVIGPGGVFTLNAKHHPEARIWVTGDHVRVNGRSHPYVRNSRHEASRAAKLLANAYTGPVHVTGLVVPVGAQSLRVKEQPRDVFVVARRAIVAWLRSRPEVLSGSAATAIFDAARQPATWRPPA